MPTFDPTKRYRLDLFDANGKILRQYRRLFGLIIGESDQSIAVSVLRNQFASGVLLEDLGLSPDDRFWTLRARIVTPSVGWAGEGEQLLRISQVASGGCGRCGSVPRTITWGS